MDLLFEFEITKTNYTPFQSLKGPDFKNVLFKNPRCVFLQSTGYVAQPIWPKSECIKLNQPSNLAGGSKGDTTRILKIRFLNSGRFRGNLL